MTRITQLTLASSINDEDQLLVRQNGIDKRIYFETIVSAIGGGGGLPSQTGNSGKYLTTNGTTASWANTPYEIPNQDGNSGKILTTNGTVISWTDTVSALTINNLTVDNILAVDVLQDRLNESFKIYLQSGSISNNNDVALVDFANRVLYDSGSASSIDWENKQINSAGATKIDWANSSLVSAGATSVNWDSKVAYDGSATSSIDWNNRVLRNSTGASALNWSSGSVQVAGLSIGLGNIMNATEGGTGTLGDGMNTSVDWISRQLKTTNGATSINWESYLLVPGGTIPSLDWSNRYCWDSGAITSINWQNRTLKNPLGNTMIDWSGSEAPIVNYFPAGGTPDVWNSTVPTTVKEALDRIASFLSTFASSTIP